MARYSDIEKIKIKVMRYLMPNVDFDGTVRVEDAERYFLNLLDEAPTADVVEVVRCKDCEYCRISIDPKTLISVQVCGYVGYNPVQSSQVTDNDFCSYGERKAQE